MTPCRPVACALLGLFVCSALASYPGADGPRRFLVDRSALHERDFVSGPGTLIFLAAGVLLPLAEDGPKGRGHSLRAADSLVTSVLLAEGLKQVFREKRPDGKGHDSFPSGHTTGAFAIAAMESEFHPQQAPLWYLGAGLIGESRLRLKAHHFQDVVAGALLGYGTAKFELARKKGILIAPFIGDNGGLGISLLKRF